MIDRHGTVSGNLYEVVQLSSDFKSLLGSSNVELRPCHVEATSDINFGWRNTTPMFLANRVISGSKVSSPPLPSPTPRPISPTAVSDVVKSVLPSPNLYAVSTPFLDSRPDSRPDGIGASGNTSWGTSTFPPVLSHFASSSLSQCGSFMTWQASPPEPRRPSKWYFICQVSPAIEDVLPTGEF
jgi:hypothetical protein